MLKALLFDLDGTLANTDPIHYEAWKTIMAGYGLEINPEFYNANFSGRLNIQIVQNLLPHLSLEEGHTVSRRKEAMFREQAFALQPIPGVMELVGWMEEQTLKRAVVTNAPKENVEFMLRVLGLDTVFPMVILGEELPLGKPDPMPYRVAMEQLGVTPETSVAFEDSPSGIRSAVGAGISTVAIASTHHPDELTPLGSSLVIPDFTDLRLETLLRARTTVPQQS